MNDYQSFTPSQLRRLLAVKSQRISQGQDLLALVFDDWGSMSGLDLHRRLLEVRDELSGRARNISAVPDIDIFPSGLNPS